MTDWCVSNGWQEPVWIESISITVSWPSIIYIKIFYYYLIFPETLNFRMRVVHRRMVYIDEYF